MHTLIALMLFACSDEKPKKGADRVVLQLKCAHHAQFAGFYVAREKGYYADEGLEVTLVEGGKDIDQCGRLYSGEADFAVFPAETVFLRSPPEHKMIALAAIYQRTAVVFASRKASKIVKHYDLLGKTLAIGSEKKGGFSEATFQYHAMMKKLGIDPAPIKILPYDPLYGVFRQDRIDITPSYLIAGVIKLRSQVIELNLVWPGDYNA
jgi:NitT/TauT family transport system substrate-binding protein